MSAGSPALPFLARWWTYQRERFPIFAHGALILAFSSSAVCYSRLLRGDPGLPGAAALLVASAASFFFFLQLRIADEFKDFEEDSRYRPYRPVPRGLVTLRSLGWLFVIGGAAQLGTALWFHPPLAAVLAGAWLYLALMSKEFFAREWLKARPITYLWTHMLIMPIVDFYGTACDWMPAGDPPQYLGAFLTVSFLNGLIIEFGRKLRAPEAEEAGVPTYSKLWGPRAAAATWAATLGAAGIVSILAARPIGFVLPAAAAALAFTAAATFQAVRFAANPSAATQKKFELISGLWTLAVYLELGLIPMLARHFYG